MRKNPCVCGSCKICDYWDTQARITEMGIFNTELLLSGVIDLQESVHILNLAAY